jgi:hypothetical protein
MALVRDARLAAILHTHASVDQLIDDRGGKDNGCCRGPGQPTGKRKARVLLAPGKRRDGPVLWGLPTGDAQTATLRLVSPTAWVTRREVLEGGGRCVVCLQDCDASTEMALFTGQSSCCGPRHSGACPLTQPGSLCFSCAAGTIGAGWNYWLDASRSDDDDDADGSVDPGPAALGQPRCPCCRVAVCEAEVVRLCVRPDAG